MSTAADEMAGRLAALRDAFDRSFAEPPRQQVTTFEDLLAIRVGGRRYALGLADTSGLHPNPQITPVPGPLPALLGVAGFGGALVPVYDLGVVLGHPSGQAPRWLVLARGAPAVGLAFAELDGPLRVPSEAIVRQAAGDGGRGYLCGVAPSPDGARPIIDVPAVRTEINAMATRASAAPGRTAHRDRSGER